MFLLLFIVFLIQFFAYWIFEPLASLLNYILEIKLLPTIALMSLVLLFSIKILGPIPWGKSSGKASTIIFWKNMGNWKLIREGEVIVRELY